MAKFRADIDEVRYYPTLGIEVSPKDVIDLPDDTVIAGFNKIKDSDTKAVPAKTAAAAADTEGV